MKAMFVALVVSSLLAGACTPANLTRLRMPVESQRAEVLIYRESSVLASLGGLIFGANRQDYVILSNGSYAQIYLSPNTYEFFVRSTGADQPYVLGITLSANTRKCLKGYPNPSNILKSLLFIPAYYMGNTFLLEEVACPSSEELPKYSKVAVQYVE